LHNDVGWKQRVDWVVTNKTNEELGFELWFGDAAQVRASVVRKQKRTGGTRSI
jgi:hypothetical protein